MLLIHFSHIQWRLAENGSAVGYLMGGRPGSTPTIYESASGGHSEWL